ncbi:MAG: CBS domain-containing protein [Rhodospirillales bacterium]|nr:CBS domain-containing protein [Rhodospirillales bacterium]MBI2978760.1 CBS domain-containing protein [Rhodospirillales bacterium]
MTVANILNEKGTKVATARPHETIGTLVHKLKLENIGAVVVSQDGKRVDGIISERDIVRGLAAHGAELLSMRIDKLMIRDVLTCAPGDSVKDVMQTMTTRRVRHLPVVENGKMVGLVSIGDVVKNRLQDVEMEARVLRDYITAR